MTLSEDTCTFEDVRSFSFDIEVKTANIMDNAVVLLFDKSVEIHELSDSGDKVILSSDSRLIDISLDKSDNILFVLREGFIKIDELSCANFG